MSLIREEISNYHKSQILSVFTASLIIALILLINPVSAENAFDNGNFDTSVVNSSGSGVNCWTTDVSKAVNGISVGIGRYDTFYYSSPYSLKYTISSTTGWYNAFIYQYVNLTNSDSLDFTLRMAGGTGYKNLTVKINNTPVYVYHPPAIDTTYYISVPISSQYRLSNVRVDIGFNSTGGDGYWYGLIDDVYADASAPIYEGVVWSGSIFEYSKNSSYWAQFNTGKNENYYVDIYGVDSEGYDLLETKTVYNSSEWEGAYQVNFTCPSSSSGYDMLYAVLRDDENYVFSTSKEILVVDDYAYMKFFPKKISKTGNTTLYYAYDYSKLYPYSDFDIKYNYFGYGNVGYPRNEIIISDLSNDTIGTYNVNVSNNLYSVPYKIGYALYRDGSNLLLEDTFEVVDNVTLSEEPVYNYLPDPEDTNNTSIPDIPDIPDNYKPPVYPDTDNDNYYDNNNETNYYNYRNDTIIYNNTTNIYEYESGVSGYYPSEISGNSSIDLSGMAGYYSYIDGVYDPLNKTVFGITGFVLSPVSSLTGYVNSVSIQFDESTKELMNEGFLVEVVRPVAYGVPAKIQGLIIYSLILNIILFLLRGDK